MRVEIRQLPGPQYRKQMLHRTTQRKRYRTQVPKQSNENENRRMSPSTHMRSLVGANVHQPVSSSSAKSSAAVSAVVAVASGFSTITGASPSPLPPSHPQRLLLPPR